MSVTHFIAAKGFVRFDNKILLIRESNRYEDGINPGFYDVPGGRLNPNENLLDGLYREVFEETGLDVTAAQLFFVNDATVEKADTIWQINRHYFICEIKSSDVVLSTDHDDFIWINALDYHTVNIIPNLTEVFDAYITSRC